MVSYRKEEYRNQQTGILFLLSDRCQDPFPSEHAYTQHNVIRLNINIDDFEDDRQFLILNKENLSTADFSSHPSFDCAFQSQSFVPV